MKKPISKGSKILAVAILVLAAVLMVKLPASAAVTEMKAEILWQENQEYTAHTYQLSSADGAIPMTVAREGVLELYMDTYNIPSASAVMVDIYSDASCGVQVAALDVEMDQLSKDGTYYYGYGYAYLRKGTYYVKIATEGTYYFSPLLIQGGDRSLQNDKWDYGYTGPASDGSTWFKYKASATGIISIYQKYDSNGSAYIKMCDSKKKKIASPVYTSSNQTATQNKAVFAVKKGATYYIKIEGSGFYSLKAKITPVKEKSGSTKVKAQAIKLGSGVKGTIMASDSKSDWYKLKLTSPARLKLTLQGNANSKDDGICFRLLGAYGGEYEVIIDEPGFKFKDTIATTYNGKLSSGTYYIQIYKYDKLSNGNYTFKITK